MENATVIKDRFTSADLEQMPNGFDRYEIIAGELYVSRQPKAEHQYTCNRLGHLLEQWNEQANLGVVLPAPGLVFADDDDVAPDLIWISRKRYEATVCGLLLPSVIRIHWSHHCWPVSPARLADFSFTDCRRVLSKG